jgi:hypothetical protein
MSMVVPDDYDVYLNGDEVQVDRATKTATVTAGESSAQTGKAAGPGYVIGNTTMGPSPTANNASVQLAVKRSDQPLAGLFAKMPWKHSLDNLAWVEPRGDSDFTETMGGIARISGILPRAGALRLTGSYHMLEGPGNPGDGVIRINGREVVRVPHGDRPFPVTPFDVDVSAYAGKHVLIELLTDGEPGRGNAAEWLAPALTVAN